MPYLEDIEHIHEDPGRIEKLVPANNSLEDCMLADHKLYLTSRVTYTAMGGAPNAGHCSTDRKQQ